MLGDEAAVVDEGPARGLRQMPLVVPAHAWWCPRSWLCTGAAAGALGQHWESAQTGPLGDAGEAQWLVQPPPEQEGHSFLSPRPPAPLTPQLCLPAWPSLSTPHGVSCSVVYSPVSGCVVFVK